MRITFLTFFLCAACCAESATDVISASGVIEWKRNVYQGLSSVGEDPYSFLADIYLMEVLKIERIPKASTQTFEVPKAGIYKISQVEALVAITRAIKALNTIQRISGENATSFGVLISNMTQTISEPAQRARVLKILNGIQ